MEKLKLREVEFETETESETSSLASFLEIGEDFFDDEDDEVSNFSEQVDFGESEFFTEE